MEYRARSTMISRLSLPALIAALLCGGFAGTVAASDPCCTITSIDKKTGIVTAADAKTKAVVQFKVDNAVLLNRIALGQKVAVDHAAAKASIVGVQGQFRIVSAPPARAPAGRPAPERARAPDACCAITAIDAKSGVVTAREAASGRTFTFNVSDAGVLRGLRAGQPVHAHFASKQVSLDGRKPCCQMASSASAAKPRTPTGGAAPIPGKTGEAAEQPAGPRTSGRETGSGVPAPSDTQETSEQSAPATDMPADATAWPQEEYSEPAAGSPWPSDGAAGFPSGAADTGYPADSGYGAFPSESPGMPAEQPSLDAGKSYSYGSGEAPVQGDVPWWKQSLPQQ